MPTLRATFVLALFLCLAFLRGDCASALDLPRRSSVLVLHSYAQDYSWTVDQHAGMMSVLNRPDAAFVYRVEYMDSKHSDWPEYLERLLELYREKYADMRFDGLLLSDNNALDFVARHRAELFPGVPIAACGINDPQSIPSDLDDAYVVIERGAHLQTLGVALKQNPGTRRVFVLVDETTTGQSIRRDFLERTRSLGEQVELVLLPLMTLDELVAFAGAREKGELLYLLPYFRDAAGKVFEPKDIPRLMAENAPVPVYVGWDFQLNTGVVGGCITSGFGHGRKAAQTLVERLEGGHPPAVYDNLGGVNQHTYDYAALKRFNISLDTLPEYAVVLNKPLTYYERHRSAIVSALVVIAILSTIIVLLAQNVARQRKINLKNEEILTLNREVIETQLEILSTLGEVIESRSHETANHVRRVAAYSRVLGELCGLTPEELALLEAVSPMHDVGKIGIPEGVLHKPDTLTKDEFEVIKHHTVIGYNILGSSGSALMTDARLVALQHHERWDGTGYPCGLKGEEIHIMARITTLADVYDALSNERIYKEAWSSERVHEFLLSQKGLMFDPRLVDIFFEHIQEFEAIKERLADAAPAGETKPEGVCPCPLGPRKPGPQEG